jgi:hypothetical protein
MEVLKMKWQMFKGFENQNIEFIIPLPTWSPKNVAGTVRYKLDITAIQEMRWIGEGVIEKMDCFLQLLKERLHISNRLYYK